MSSRPGFVNLIELSGRLPPEYSVPARRLPTRRSRKWAISTLRDYWSTAQAQPSSAWQRKMMACGVAISRPVTQFRSWGMIPRIAGVSRRRRSSFIMVWLEVRSPSGPTTQSDTNRRFPVSNKSPQFAGILAVSNTGRAVSDDAEGAIAWILAPSLWAPQTRSWRARPELDVKADRIKDSKRQTEDRVLAGPLGRGIAETSDADAARQLVPQR